MVHLKTPDPNYTTSRRARANFRLAVKVALWAAGVLWFILLADAYLGLNLYQYGLRPRSATGALGILTAPLIHADAEHLFSNTAPLVVSLVAALYLYPNASVRAIPYIWVGSGVLAWLIGRPSLHFGASGFVYGLLAFVFVGGVLRQDFRSIAVSLMVWFLYGSMVWGVLPIRTGMSWELHACGALLGLLMAVLYRRWDRPPIKRYEWEDDDTVPDWFPEASDENGAPRDESEDGETDRRRGP